MDKFLRSGIEVKMIKHAKKTTLNLKTPQLIVVIGFEKAFYVN